MAENKKLDVVYILGVGSKWNDNELRFSLRSIERYYLNLGNVYVVGEKPKWLSDEVIHLPAKDPYLSKSRNGLHKIFMAATELPELSNPFLLFNDDFFLTTAIDEFKVYDKGLLADMLQRHPSKSGYYYDNMRETYKLLIEAGVENPKDFGVHYPGIFTKEQVTAVVDNYYTQDSSFLLRTLMGNLYNWQSETVIDFKANNLAEFATQRMLKREVISISDFMAGYGNVQDWLTSKFGKVSKYENDNGQGLYDQPQKGNMRVYASRNFVYNGVEIYAGNLIPDSLVDLITKNPTFNNKWRHG